MRNALISHVAQRGAAGISAPSIEGEFSAALLGLSPFAYFPLRETEGPVLSLVDDYEGIVGSNVVLADVAGADDFDYPRFPGGTSDTHRIESSMDTSYLGNDSGLSFVALIRRSGSQGTGDRFILSSFGGGGVALRSGSSSSFAAFTESGGGLARLKGANSLATLDSWQLLVGTYSPDGAEFPLLYLNGTSVGSESGSGTATGPTSESLHIGRNTRGAIAHAAIFKRRLSQQEVTDLATAADSEGWISL